MNNNTLVKYVKKNVAAELISDDSFIDDENIYYYTMAFLSEVRGYDLATATEQDLSLEDRQGLDELGFCLDDFKED